MLAELNVITRWSLSISATQQSLWNSASNQRRAFPPDPIDLTSSIGHLAEGSRITGRKSSTRFLSNTDTHSNNYRGPEIGFGGTPDTLSQIARGEAMFDLWCL